METWGSEGIAPQILNLSTMWRWVVRFAPRPPPILVTRLTPYADEITGYHQCEFWQNRSTTDQKFCICQILEYNVTEHQLFIDEGSHESALHKIVIKFGNHETKICLFRMVWKKVILYCQWKLKVEC